jgi:polyhydroxyalkanoate synthesis repressor PhaR
MAKSDPPVSEPVKIRKYPNRRYYDVTRSRHVTLEEMYRLVCNGSDIEVTDSKSGNDITAKVLAQIILEHDPPKMGVFPTQLLHEVIRANESLVRDFVEKYFHRAFMAFAESQKSFERYFRQAMGLGTQVGSPVDWARMMFGGLAVPPVFSGDGQSGSPDGRPASQSAADTDELRSRVEELQGELQRLRDQLNQK